MVEQNSLKLSAIQLNTKPNVEANLLAISAQLEQLTAEKHSGDHLVVLPECCLFFGENDKAQWQLAKQSLIVTKSFSSSLQLALSQLASRYQVYLVAGTMPLLTSQGTKYTNSCCMFSPSGEILGCYDKIHLFDVEVEDNEQSYYESRYTQAGNSPCLVKTAQANIGLTVCFDLRFPTLFQTLTALGANIITVPSAFTRVTGKAHWQTLLQARAIENQVYIIAAGQEGVHENGRETWGHSMIISPWGEILACLEEGEGSISASFSSTKINKIRAAMPLNSPLFKDKITES